MSTNNREQDVPVQAIGFLKGCISYLQSQKFKIVTEKLQHTNTFLNYSQKNKAHFSAAVHKRAANIILYCSPPQPPLSILSLSRAIHSFFSHLVTLRLFLLYDIQVDAPGKNEVLKIVRVYYIRKSIQ